jgi:hypothetical protein
VDPGVLPVGRLEGGVGSEDRPLGSLEVDPGALGKPQLDRVSARDRVGAERTA